MALISGWNGMARWIGVTKRTLFNWHKLYLPIPFIKDDKNAASRVRIEEKVLEDWFWCQRKLRIDLRELNKEERRVSNLPLKFRQNKTNINK